MKGKPLLEVFSCDDQQSLVNTVAGGIVRRELTLQEYLDADSLMKATLNGIQFEQIDDATKAAQEVFR